MALSGLVIASLLGHLTGLILLELRYNCWRKPPLLEGLQLFSWMFLTTRPTSATVASSGGLEMEMKQLSYYFLFVSWVEPIDVLSNLLKIVDEFSVIMGALKFSLEVLLSPLLWTLFILNVWNTEFLFRNGDLQFNLGIDIFNGQNIILFVCWSDLIIVLIVCFIQYFD